MAHGMTTGRLAWVRVFVLALCLAGAPLLCGCVAILGGAAAGAATVVYFKGNLDQTVDVPLVKLHAAAVQALNDLSLPVTRNEADATTVSLESKYADGADVWIVLTSMTPGSTKIHIRVGIMGDETRARAILDGIEKNAGIE